MNLVFWLSRLPYLSLVSILGRGSRNWNFARLGLVAEAGSTLIVPLIRILRFVLTLSVVITLITIALLIIPALISLWVLLLRSLPVRLPLLLRLVHGIQDTEVMFRVLKERLRGNAIPAAGRVSAKLQIFFE